MQTLDELARVLSQAEAGAPDSILFQWHLPDLFQQSGFAFRLKENLRLSKVSEFLSSCVKTTSVSWGPREKTD